MNKGLKWTGITLASIVVLAGASYGLTMVNKNSLANKYLQNNKIDLVKKAPKDTKHDSKDVKMAAPESKKVKIDSLLTKVSLNGSVAALNKKTVATVNGYSNLEKHTKLTKNDKFIVSQAQDLINVGIIMHYIDQGKVKLSNTIDKYDSKVPGASEITIQNVLNGTTGLTNGSIQNDQSMDELISYLHNTSSYNSSNRGNYADSASNSILLADLIQKISGKQYKTVINGLLETNNLTHTKFKQKNRTVTYYTQDSTSDNPIKASSDSLNRSSINRLKNNQLVVSSSDLRELLASIFNKNYVSQATIKKVLSNSSDYLGEFAITGDKVILSQTIAGGENYINWNLKTNSGTVILSNTPNDTSLGSLASKIQIKLEK